MATSGAVAVTLTLSVPLGIVTGEAGENVTSLLVDVKLTLRFAYGVGLAVKVSSTECPSVNRTVEGVISTTGTTSSSTMVTSSVNTYVLSPLRLPANLAPVDGMDNCNWNVSFPSRLLSS